MRVSKNTREGFPEEVSLEQSFSAAPHVYIMDEHQRHQKQCTPKGVLWELPTGVVIRVPSAKKWAGARAWG